MTDTLVNVPTLDSLLADPAKAATLPPEVAQRLLIGLVSIQPLLIQRAVMMGANLPAAGSPERFLSVGEVASQYGVTASWLYRHKRQLPHSQPSRKVLLFPEEKLRRWFAARKTG
jgi:predicted DNA-binding transcriptional regulator AlpA